MSDECERCNGDGTINGDVGDLPCPNCHDDVCQWCNAHFEDGEELGDTGLHVCRDCIRDMATYKEQVCYTMHVAYELRGFIDDMDGLQRELTTEVKDTFARYGIDLNDDDDGWVVRPPDGGGE